MSNEEVEKRGKTYSWVALTIMILGFFGSIQPYILMALSGRGMQGMADGFHGGGAVMWLIALWNLPAYILIIVCGVLMVRGRAIPSVVLFIGPLIVVLLALLSNVLAQANFAEGLQSAAPEQRAYYSGYGITQTLTGGSLALLLAAQMLMVIAYCSSIRAWARVEGARRWLLLAAAAVLGASVFVGTLMVRYVVPDWARDISNIPVSSAFAFWALAPLVLAVGAVTAKAPAEQRGAAWRDLIVVAVAPTLAMYLSARYIELSNLNELWSALPGAAPWRRFDFLARGMTIATKDFWVSLLPLLVITPTLLPSIAGLFGGAAGEALKRRLVASIAGLFVIATVFFVGEALSGQTYSAFTRYMGSAYTYQFDDREQTRLPVFRMHRGRGAFDEQVVELNAKGVSFDGRLLGELALLDTAEGQARLGQALVASIDWEKAQGSQREQRHPCILIAADKTLPASRVIGLMDVMSKGRTIEGGLLYEIANPEELPAVLEDLPPRYQATWFKYGAERPGPNISALFESLGPRARVTRPGREPREMHRGDMRVEIGVIERTTPIVLVPAAQDTVVDLVDMLRLITSNIEHDVWLIVRAGRNPGNVNSP